MPSGFTGGIAGNRYYIETTTAVQLLLRKAQLCPAQRHRQVFACARGPRRTAFREDTLGNFFMLTLAFVPRPIPLVRAAATQKLLSRPPAVLPIRRRATHYHTLRFPFSLAYINPSLLQRLEEAEEPCRLSDPREFDAERLHLDEQILSKSPQAIAGHAQHTARTAQKQQYRAGNKNQRFIALNI